MSGTLNRLAIDTNIFVYFLGADRHFGPNVARFFSEFATGQVELVTSVITVTELFSLSSMTGIDVKKGLKTFYELPVKVITIDEEIALNAARLRREYSFRTPDALQLATAQISGASQFVTADKRLKSFIELPITIIKPVRTDA